MFFMTHRSGFGSRRVVLGGGYRYYRINISATSSNNGAIITELRIFAADLTTPITPGNMTSDILPSPYVASASTTASWGTGQGAAFRAFDGVTTGANGWFSGDSALPAWLKIDLAAETIAGSYSVQNRADANNRRPTDWTFEGSNDDTVWDVLDTQTGITWASNGETQTFNL